MIDDEEVLTVLPAGSEPPDGAIAVPPGVLCFILPPYEITGGHADVIDRVISDAAANGHHILFQEPGWKVIVIPQP